MNNKYINAISATFNTAINILFIGYPIRTSLGALFGTFLMILSKIFSPILNKIPNTNIGDLKDFHFILLGIFIFHIQTFSNHFWGKNKLSENEERAFAIIREAKKLGISPWETQNMYLRLIEKILNNIELNSATKEELKKMMEN